MKSSTTSFIYRNIFIYRSVMNLLYTGSYSKRFELITTQLGRLNPASVLELCFGDIKVATYCRNHHIQWKGIDINPSFIRYAKNNGFDVMQEDITLIDSYPQVDVILMAGSLYHFHDDVSSFFQKIFLSTNNFILSEPVRNISQQQGIIGSIAKKSANAGNGNETVRYDLAQLKNVLHEMSGVFHFSIELIGEFKKDAVFLLRKKRHLF